MDGANCPDVRRGDAAAHRLILKHGTFGLAARPPYFHNGAAADLSQVVNFYDQRFQMSLTPEQRTDLVAFLAAL